MRSPTPSPTRNPGALSRHRSLVVAALLWGGLLAPVQATHGADELLQNIVFTGVPSGPILRNIESNVSLLRSGDTAKRIAESQQARAIAETKRQIIEAVKPYGYYRPEIQHSESNGNSLVWEFKIDLGPPVRVGMINIELLGAGAKDPELAAWLRDYPLRIGDTLDQTLYESARNSLSRLSNRRGYFDARFPRHSIAMDENRLNAQIDLAFDTGPRYQFGPAQIVWTDPAKADDELLPLINSYIQIKAGEPWDEDRLQQLQSELSTSPLFQSVAVKPALDAAAGHQVPIEIHISTYAKHVYAASLGYGTDTGPRATLGYTNRRLNSAAHSFSINLYTAEERRTLGANYRIPLTGAPTDAFNIFASRSFEESSVRDYSNTIVGVDLSRSRGDWQWSYGLSYRDESVAASSLAQDSQLLMPSTSLQYLSADNLSLPTQGWKMAGTLRGAHDDLLSDLTFLQLSLEAKLVQPLPVGRFLARAQAALSVIDGDGQLPESLRFFTGGDNSVRGYAFESIGVDGADGTVIGAQNRVSASLEYEYPLRNSLALAAFADVGDAFDSSLSLKKGVGLGLRYRLPFGAFRFDVATALDLPDTPWRLHITFGTDL